ncbi:LysR family transcriptional regulator [Kocuria coralli]|uniref:LysR family transcriptional regulator n=1 Tax=Kocuria coralli TaxID=1461025 RepID=A0A5J5KYW4_9MICC|nr:LysR family transcriptional regulator [Kocuria coralli]KAA9394026.1 LysR family transcriptional regulator [Kocuria coralli]
MDARQLRYFLGVVDHRTFARAAQELHISQPSLSQSIRQLERSLRVDLFIRTGRGTELTEAGRQLLGPARQVLRDLETAQAAVASARDLERGTVDIVTMPSAGIEPLTTLIRRFRDLHPGMSINAAAAFTSDEVVSAVSSGVSEVGLLGASSHPPTADLPVIPLGSQPLILVSPPGSVLETASPDGATGLDGLEVVITPRGSIMRQVVDDFTAEGADVVVAAEVAHRTSLLPLVLAGVGHTVLPKSWEELAKASGCRVTGITPPTTLHMFAVHRAQGLTPGARAVVELLHGMSHPTHQ